MIASCPLCHHSKHHVVDQLTGKELRDLWKVLGANFTAEAWPIRDDQAIERFQCDTCGFLFSDPALAGNEAFYKQLEHSEYFSPHRDEFQRTLDFARGQGLKRLLDVGCGSGIFLDLARNAGFQTFGVELNANAAEKARQKGHRVFNRLLSDLNLEQTGGTFDLITLFQVLEHVPSPVQILTEAKSLLQPGGFISVAVPSADGLSNFAPWDPGLWPPHHVSLWQLSDFPVLAQPIGMPLIESGGDILLGGGIEQRWNLRNRLAPVVGKPRLPGGTGFPALVGFIYRKTGMKFIFPKRGSSIYAYFRKE